MVCGMDELVFGCVDRGGHRLYVHTRPPHHVAKQAGQKDVLWWWVWCTSNSESHCSASSLSERRTSCVWMFMCSYGLEGVVRMHMVY